MDESSTIRVDKWLWAARFFKTRSAAASAVTAGRVKVNGGRVKSSHQVREGDQLSIRKPPYEFVIDVRQVSNRRGPAKEAVKLYQETPQSVAAREKLALTLKAEAASRPSPTKGRPTKRDRRVLSKLKGR